MGKCMTLCILLWVFAVPAYGDYYKYEDQDGNIIITDNPTSMPENSQSRVITIKEPEETQVTAPPDNLPLRRPMESAPEFYGAAPAPAGMPPLIMRRETEWDQIIPVPMH